MREGRQIDGYRVKRKEGSKEERKD